MELLNNRDVAYDALFAGELPYEAQPAEEDIGIAALWRAHTHKGGTVDKGCKAHLDGVSESVSEILMDHDMQAREENGDALFAVVDTKVLSHVIDVTSRIIKTWERALWSHREDYIMRPVDASRYPVIQPVRQAHSIASRSLVIETAASVLYTLPLVVKDAFNPSPNAKGNLARVLANWGPQFLRQWLDGAIITWWLKQENVPDHEIKEWQESFTPSIRKHLMSNNVSDPLGALVRIKRNLESLTDEVIAEELGWTISDVEDLITPGTRKYYAVGNIDNPLKGLRSMLTNLRRVTDEVVAQHLQISPKEAQTYLTQRDRKIIVMNAGSITQALRSFKANLDAMSHDAIADTLGWSKPQVVEFFTPHRIKQLALKNRNPFTTLEDMANKLTELTPDFIAQQIRWPIDTTEMIFTPSICRAAVFSNTKDPLVYIRKIKAGIDSLSDEAIACRLGWSEERAKAEVSLFMRRRFVLEDINDPLRALAARYKST